MAKLDTRIERLVEYIKLNKNVTIEQTAKALGMTEKQLEQLAEALSESKLIDIRYEFSGIRLTPKLIAKEIPKEKEEKEKNANERMENIEEELLNIEKMFDFSQRDIIRRIQNAIAHFRKIEEIELETESPEKSKEKVRNLLQDAKKFDGKIETLEKALEEFKKEAENFLKRVEDAKRLKYKEKKGSLIDVIKNLFGLKVRK